ncbi:hypothetical protein HBA55_24005 [Pseudomaricurvus alkylphenolicus]|uniref:hypothetical protein n=1 Tax=Pseudomaricurvus alkylphenolicus TaxID=1306991 RepID=UPI001420FAE4|nr:hypothetical protein [Pseudomaricurvus alkylphenolicus]NIB42692.1 hypothetical protein [Pseudomaricurvus alkylphenolicus]
MSYNNYHPAPLDKSALQALQSLEQEFDLTMVAVEQDPQPAHLTDDQLARLKELESKLGVSIVAYTKH